MDRQGTVTVRAVGDHALLLEVDSGPQVAALYARLLAERARGGLGGATEIVPAARTVLLDGLPRPAELAGRLGSWRVAGDAPPEGPLIEVPTVYDGADLAAVAAHWGSRPRRRWRCTAGSSTGWRSAASRPASAT